MPYPRNLHEMYHLRRELYAITGLRGWSGQKWKNMLQEEDRLPQPHTLSNALTQKNGVSIIAEIKHYSPAAGDLFSNNLDVIERANQYAAGGASAISVVTDDVWFKGSLDDLGKVASMKKLPVLHKDFIISEFDIYMSCMLGACAALLIVSELSDEELSNLNNCLDGLSMEGFYEVRSAHDIDRACTAGAKIIAVNQRDLNTFEMTHEIIHELRPYIPNDVVAVAASAVKKTSDIHKLADSNYDAALIGEYFMRSEQPERIIQELISLK